MSDKVRPYLFYDVAVSICSTCLRRVEGKIVFEDGRVYMLKACPLHGNERVLMADDVDYYRRCREVFLKPPEQPNHYNTPLRWGCPYDCGICPSHEQHSCLTLIEVTDQCNLTCPVCYAASGPHRPGFRTLEHIERMLDCVVRNEREPDVVQISGGEPTIHPEFFAILDAARRRPIKHLMVNTNGIRIAKERAFVERMARYMPGFELYLQFDSLQREPLMKLRGADLRSVREQAIAHLNEFNLSTTLVVTLEKGVNDGEIGAILEYAARQRCVRGVTFQPVQSAGRLDGYAGASERLTVSEVRRRILEQFPVFKPADIMPVPCHPDSLAMAYALRMDGGLAPLTGLIEPQVLIDGSKNTIVYEQDSALHKHLFKVLATNHSPISAANSLKELLCCLPQVAVPKGFGYDRVFRVIIMQFIDAQSFDLRSVKKTCVHIVHPDARRIIPFDTYNLFYRDGLEQQVLEPLRRAAEAAAAFL
ncbi:MAG: radical SAM protein [Candidatus Eisenbacteria bacterium]